MSKMPQATGLILCKRIEMDMVKAEYSLIGLMSTLTFSSWPALAPQLMGYAALYRGKGEGRLQMLVMRMETEEIIYRYQRWHTFPDPNVINHVEISMHRCTFPAPGRYAFQLDFDQIPLSERFLDVRNAGARP